MSEEKRPELFVTYTHDDPDEAEVLDVAGSLEEAHRQPADRTGCPIYRLTREGRGVYQVRECVGWVRLGL